MTERTGATASALLSFRLTAETQLLIRLIMGDDKITVVSSEAQYTVTNTCSHEVRLDILSFYVNGQYRNTDTPIGLLMLVVGKLNRESPSHSPAAEERETVFFIFRKSNDK